MTRKLYIYVLAFLSGMCIMAVELSASRLIAPYFGTSTYVWTNVIGIIMVALSLGYFLGGKLADRTPRIEVLLRILAGASLLLLAIPFIAPPVSQMLVGAVSGFHSGFHYIFIGSMVLVTLLFFAPILLLGMTSPFLIRIFAEDHTVGISAGRIFGISTFGSIAGTFLPVLVFIPAFGTGKTVLVFSVLLLLVSIAGLTPAKKLFVLPLVAAPLLIPVPPAREHPGKVFAAESGYQYLSVVDRGPYRYLLSNDGLGAQSAIRRDSILTGLYFDYFSLVPYLVPRGKTALLLGMGGGTVVNQLREFHPELRITAVEIDPKVVEIAKQFFSLADGAELHTQDGRIFLATTRNRYDLIFIDAYMQQLYIPFHMTTAEFFAQVREKLHPGGVLAMNVAAYRGNSLLCASIVRTLRLGFPHVYQLTIPNTSSNLVLAANEPIAFSLLVKTVGTKLQDLGTYMLANAREPDSHGTARIFTDDNAPTEHLIDWELLSVRERF